jgi:hypothetical protein
MSKLSTKSILVVFLLISSVIFSACAGAAAPRDLAVANESAPLAMAEGSAVMTGNLVGQTDQDSERIVIKNGNLVLVVSDPAASMERISRLAEEMGGFVVSADLTHTELNSGRKVPQARVVIRVPVEGLNEALDIIRSESDQPPVSENVSSQDVTREYTDLQSRLRNEQAAEAQLAQIMEQATRTEDVLNVYNQLVQVRERIEVLQGQIQYYEQSAALSSISTELLVDEAVQPLTIGRWQLGGAAKQAVQSLLDTLEFLSRAFIWFVIYLLPVLLVIFLLFVLPVILVIRYFRRRSARRKASEVKAKVEEPDQQS